MELTTDAVIALLTLTAMEVVLGIDNIVFISILVDKVPVHLQQRIRSLGISMALIMRLGLLFSISWLMGLTRPLFGIWEKEFSGRDLILLVGGLFLIAKATYEIHDKLEGEEPGSASGKGKLRNASIIFVQILILDLVFSLDSVITAVGMAQEIWIMVVAMVVSVIVMLVSAKAIGEFVSKHPTIKILALSFLLLIGVMLVAEGMGKHIPKGYIYFAMAFSLGVELLNMRLRRSKNPVRLKETGP